MRNATQLQLIRNGKIFQAAARSSFLDTTNRPGGIAARSSLTARGVARLDRSSQLPDISQLGRSSQLTYVWTGPALARYPVHSGRLASGRGGLEGWERELLTICSHKKIDLFTNLRPGKSARAFVKMHKKKRTITRPLFQLLGIKFCLFFPHIVE